MQPGTELNHYRIVDKLGEGGMGVVYRAEDTKLRREVAIKVLPAVVANDPDRLARFEREAHLLAALNHGGIASIYGLEEAAGMRFLVMELVPGENLEHHLAAGRPELRRAIEIGKSVAEALEEAHSKGIIHRDLKPANVMVTADGKVKVLDLGLAKALVGEGGSGNADVSMSPTVAVAGTAAGVILGTAAYMSPEQARGQELDGRTDIWSFGCLLYEVLTSRRAFTGATVSDLTAAILKEEPDWTGIPAATPMSVRQLLQRCLQKDARRRLQAIGDARIELEDALRQIDNVADGTVPSGIDPLSGSMVGASSGFNVSAPGSPTVAAPAPSRGFGLAAVAVAVLSGAIAGAATGWLLRSPADTEGAPLTRLAVPVNGMRVDNVAISPDGRDLSLEARGDDGIWRLYRRQMETGALQPIAGSDEVYMPQFGANGAWLVGINDASALVRLAIGGSAPTVLTTDTAASTTYALLDDDRLLFGDSRRGLSLVPAGGGPSRSLIEPDLERGETALLFPVALPGSTHALYTAMVSAQGGVPNRLMAVDLASGASEIVMENARRAHYLPSGHLVFDRGESLWAVEFDPSTRRTLGDPVQLVDGVFYGQGRSVWAISDNGTLVFQEGEATVSSMELVRAGADEDVDEGAVILSGETFEWPMLSADGNHLVAAIHGADQHGVWSYDVARGTRLRLSFVGNDGHPLWSPDGKTVVFYSGTSNGGNLYAVAADGSDGEAATQLTDSPLGLIPRSFSPDGRYLIFTQVTENAGGDILALDMESGEEEPILNSSFDENWGMVSPSGDWLAYTSDESGSVEVYLRPFGRNGPKIPVSSGGGDVPTWSVDGRTLYYRQGSTVMAASFSGGDEPDLGATRVIRDDVGAYYYPVPGSDAMILSRSSGAAADLPDHLVVIPNAIDEIRRRLGTQ